MCLTGNVPTLLVSPVLRRWKLVYLLGDFSLLTEVRLIVVGVLVDVDDARRQGTLLFLSHGGATRFAVAIAPPVKDPHLLRLLLFSRDFFHAAPVQHLQDVRVCKGSSILPLVRAAVVLCLTGSWFLVVSGIASNITSVVLLRGLRQALGEPLLRLQRGRPCVVLCLDERSDLRFVLTRIQSNLVGASPRRFKPSKVCLLVRRRSERRPFSSRYCCLMYQGQSSVRRHPRKCFFTSSSSMSMKNRLSVQA